MKVDEIDTLFPATSGPSWPANERNALLSATCQLLRQQAFSESPQAHVLQHNDTHIWKSVLEFPLLTKVTKLMNNRRMVPRRIQNSSSVRTTPRINLIQIFANSLEDVQVARCMSGFGWRWTAVFSAPSVVNPLPLGIARDLTRRLELGGLKTGSANVQVRNLCVDEVLFRDGIISVRGALECAVNFDDEKNATETPVVSSQRPSKLGKGSSRSKKKLRKAKLAALKKRMHERGRRSGYDSDDDRSASEDDVPSPRRFDVRLPAV